MNINIFLNKKLACKLLIFLQLGMANSDLFAQNDEPEVFEPAPGSAIPFEAFKIEDFCKRMVNGNCQLQYSSASDRFNNPDVFDGTIGEYVAYLNEMEQLYNMTGRTLRPESDGPDDERTSPYELPTSAAELESQLLALLEMDTQKVLSHVLGLDPEAECPSLPIPGRDVEDPGFKFPRFSVPGISDMPLDEIISRFNEHQDILCSLGMSLYDKLDPNKKYRPKELISKLMEIRNEILEKLGLSEYSGHFSMESVQKLQAGLDVIKDLNDLISAREVPSPEQLFALRQKLNVVLPEDWQIPDVPRHTCRTRAQA